MALLDQLTRQSLLLEFVSQCVSLDSVADLEKLVLTRLHWICDYDTCTTLLPNQQGLSLRSENRKARDAAHNDDAFISRHHAVLRDSMVKGSPVVAHHEDDNMYLVALPLGTKTLAHGALCVARRTKGFSHDDVRHFQHAADALGGALTRIAALIAGHEAQQTIKLTESKFRATAERYRLSLEASGNIGTWTVDPETNLTVMDAKFAELFGVDPSIASEGVEITHFTQRIHPEDRPTVLAAVSDAIKAGGRYDIDYRIVQPKGNIVWVTAKGKMFQDEKTGKKQFAGVAVDITARKHIEQKLQDNDRQKDEFLAMLAHELRNPLAPISAAAELLKIGGLNTERVRKTSEVITRQVRHMTSLVDDLLDVSRVARGLISLDFALFDISYAVGEAIEQVMPLMRARGHHLISQLTPGRSLVNGDQKRLVQVIANLLTIAAKFTHDGGKIQIKVEVQVSNVVIQVSDNGIGMAPELVTNAFDLFVQGERSSDRSSGGLGLGLALVKNLVELHAGTVVCESPGTGRGTTFTVGLPRLDTQDVGKQVPDLSAVTQNDIGSLRIMVVDDNNDAASMLSMLLEASGHMVFVENRSVRVLERAKIERPQVFLLDIGLPEMDGNELAKILRAHPETANTVLIAVTGYGQENDRLQSLASGFDHHLVKPVDTEKLIALLANISQS